MPIPQTNLISTSHGISIMFGGDTIGMIQTWNPGQTRGVASAYELRADTSGEVVEQVPGNLGGLTIGITRYDLFKKKMEQIWGFKMIMLTDQKNAIDIKEKLLSKTDVGTTTEIFMYEKCWFTNLGRTISATGDRIINVNATLAYTRKIEIVS